MELWNTIDGTLQTIVDSLPQQVQYRYTGARMISVNKNTELVFFGGWSTNFVTEVWKYKYDSNTWELLGSLQSAREDPLVMQVYGLGCP
jgi:hypothetical protein